MGFWELVVVLVIGLIVLGPERMPTAIRTVSGWVKSIKGMAHSVKAEVNEELRVHELHSHLKKAEELGMENLPDDIKRSIAELSRAAESVQGTYRTEQTQEAAQPTPPANPENHDNNATK